MNRILMVLALSSMTFAPRAGAQTTQPTPFKADKVVVEIESAVNPRELRSSESNDPQVRQQVKNELAQVNSPETLRTKTELPLYMKQHQAELERMLRAQLPAEMAKNLEGIEAVFQFTHDDTNNTTTPRGLIFKLRFGGDMAALGDQVISTSTNDTASRLWNSKTHSIDKEMLTILLRYTAKVYTSLYQDVQLRKRQKQGDVQVLDEGQDVFVEGTESHR